MKKVYVRPLTLFFMLVFPFLSFAQKHWETSLCLGYTNYFGDLVEPVFTFKEPHPAAQFYLRKNFDAKHSYRLNFLYGKLSGDDANYERLAPRGNSFEMSFMEISSIFEIDLLGQKRYPKKGQFSKTFSPYILLGLGLTLGHPEVHYGDDENIDNTIEYPHWHVSIPAGFGLKMDIVENMYVGLEFAHRVTLSDNLDGVQLSGNAYNNDSFFFGGLTFGFRFLKNPSGVPMTIEE